MISEKATKQLQTERRATDDMGLKEMAVAMLNQISVILINSCGILTFYASKPPLLLALNITQPSHFPDYK